MENGNGIKGKAPSYIQEKFDIARKFLKVEDIIGYLDSKNLKKYNEYVKRWKNHLMY